MYTPNVHLRCQYSKKKLFMITLNGFFLLFIIIIADIVIQYFDILIF
jgi:hypothetical protein